MRLRIAPVIIGLLLMAWPPSHGTLWAAEPQSLPEASPIAAAALVANTQDVVPGRPFDVALRLRLPDGWHTYWRNTGDAGAPTAIAWTLPAGFTVGPLAWPIPTRYVTGPVVSYGLAGDVRLLTRITPPADLRSGSTATLTAEADWLVCAHICIPEAATLSLRLPVAAAARPAPPELRQGFDAARGKLPEPYPRTATVGKDRDRLLLDVEMPAAATVAIDEAWFFPDRFGVIDNAGAQTHERTGQGLRVILPPAAPPSTPDAVSGVLVLKRAGERRGYSITASNRS